jgi:hypothetical protein
MAELICSVNEIVYNEILKGKEIIYVDPDTGAESLEVIKEVHEIPKTNTLNVSTVSGEVFTITTKKDYKWIVNTKNDIPATTKKRNKKQKRRK